MPEKAFQDEYAPEFAMCYGCGRLNEHGLHIQSRWDGDETVCIFQPRDYHIAIPGYVYGGLIASLIDCHSTGTAAAAAAREQGREIGSDPPLRFVAFGAPFTSRDSTRRGSMRSRSHFGYPIRSISCCATRCQPPSMRTSS